MTQKEFKEKRIASRRDISLRALIVGDRLHRTIITNNIGPYGAFFVGNYPVKQGARLRLRLYIPVKENDKSGSTGLDVYVSVVRVESGTKEIPEGFAAQWIRASSVGDVYPLKEFLKTYLQIGGGFAHVLKPESEGEVPVYSFFFPKPDQTHVAPADIVEPVSKDAGKELIQARPDIPPVDAENKKTAEPLAEPDVPTRVYATLPIHYIYSEKTFDGIAIKLKQEGVRIDSTDKLPKVYSPITIEIPVDNPGKKETLPINGTVSLVKISKHGKGGQFEIKFSLKNSPVVLDKYREILKMLQESVRQS